MPDLPSRILSQLVNTPHQTRLKQAYLTAVDLAEGEVPPWANGQNGTAISFQYWPETIQDTRPSNWSPRPIPGGSHPIYQWTGGGERRISFTAAFTTDTDPGDSSFDFNAYESLSQSPLSGIEPGVRDIDLRSVVSWLRYFTYPLYGEGEDLRVFEPPKVQIHLPNSRIGYNGVSYVLAVMTQCDVTYEAFFPNGLPRIIEIALEFAEVVQSNSGVRFHDRRDMDQSLVLGGISALNPYSGQ